MFLSVALLNPPYTTLTYAAGEWLGAFGWSAGLRVVVPLGRRVLCPGVILHASEQPLADLPPEIRLRPIIWPLEKEPLLSGEYLELIRQLALRQAVSPGQILASVLPIGLRVAKSRLRLFSKGRSQIRSLPQLAVMAEDTKEEARQEIQRLGDAWLHGEAELLESAEDEAASEECVLQVDPPWTVRPSACRQIALLDLLLEEGNLSRREVLRRLGAGTPSALKALVNRGLVALRRRNEIEAETEAFDGLLPPAFGNDLILSEDQQKTVRMLLQELDSKAPCSHLLFGVTGSGKTAVYMELIRVCLDQGHSALLLAPEVALACKLRRDAMRSLPKIPIYFFHGYQSPQARERVFRELSGREQPCLVIGTRSALFLPLSRPGVIILDEEHDSSFKQDEGLPYQAKEIAWFRIRQSGGLLLLGSATPDLKTFHAAQTSRILFSSLPVRVGGGALPDIRLIDIRHIRNADLFFAPESLEALKKTVARGEQAVVLLNRRGYAPVMYCLDCGKPVRCPQCDISLTYHKKRERLICHYCGYTVPFPSPCPGCKSLHYHPMGLGTERIEEFLAGVMPQGGGILRLDKDSTRREGRMESILESFARKEAQILVGTQMLSKGHHFPDVTLVVVADADLGLNLPDYRAAERTFQLLVQSAGRAGRGSKPGQVLVQTRDVQHYCWRFIQDSDYEGFYAHEIGLRQRHQYPPFVNLALLRISYPSDWEEGKEQLTRIAVQLREKSRPFGMTVLGPAPAPLPLLRGRRRFQCLLKAHDWQAIRTLYSMIAPLASPPRLRIMLDIDPVSML